jgi:NADH-quinone oxidoreductase subunit J
MPSVLLIALLTLGGIGLYLAMPGGRVHLARAALILLAGAAAALVALVLPLAGEHGRQVWFALLALVGLVGAVRVITHRRPVYSALYFILVVIAVAGMLILMQAEFLAVALLIIYAGAILVTYVFVIMLAQQAGGPAPYDQRAHGPLAGVVTGFILLAALTWRLAQSGSAVTLMPEAHVQRAFGGVASVGTHLLTQYVVGIELAGVLLLAAMVGAIAIARRRVSAAQEGEVG